MVPPPRQQAERPRSSRFSCSILKFDRSNTYLLSGVDDSVVYRVVGSEVSLVQLNDEEYVVYNDHASDSSVLNIVDACLLHFLISRGAKGSARSELTRYTSHELQIPVDDLAHYVAASLEQMAEVGLIFAGPPS